MNFSKRNKSIVDFIFIIVLFGAFSITSLLVVILGANVYKKTVYKMDVNYANRTALSYVTEKIRSHDFNSGIQIKDADVNPTGQSAVLLKDMVNDRTFVTYLFVKDGVLKEFTTSGDYDFDYNAGTDVLNVEEFSVDLISPQLYKIRIVDSYGDETDFFTSVYSEVDE